MKIKPTHLIMAVVAYEVVAYAWNSYKVSQPSPAGQAVTGLLPFDFLSTLLGGYMTASNPTGGVAGMGAYIRGPTGTPGIQGWAPHGQPN